MCYSLVLSFRACYGVLRFVMESGGKGCEVHKFILEIHRPFNECDILIPDFLSVRHVLLRQVKIMLDLDPKGKQGPTTPLPDLVTIHPPKDEEEYTRPAVLVPAEITIA
ncbi:hypothetical protein ZIOFF_008019 [Zingiber officinale]|uniref:Uncharacterized protein n=1 Tax=Zingiber officinale TaxID=94328 RepID=A0A8J5IET4_ZINOF|nr:hypothetical protein ZIOFF_008019 [Zingiber officinale]